MLCTANQCRSPLAERLLADALVRRGVDADVRSAGFLPGGQPISPETVAVLEERGIVPPPGPSRRLEPRELVGADLVLAMARLHVREAVVLAPSTFSRTFTVKELARRGGELGPRKPDETVGEWLDRAHVGRDHSLHLGESPDDDVADPVGQSLRVFRSTATELDHHLGQIVDLLWSPVTAGR